MNAPESKILSMLDVDPYEVPLDRIDVSQAELHEQNAHWPFFERLRKEDPVHYCANSEFGPYWSVTKFNDIAYVEKNHEIFSSQPTVTISDPPKDAIPFEAFLQMDPPKHDEQRAAVQGSVAPGNLARMEIGIRQRAAEVLDNLPIGETFDWVDKVSIELTTQMLAILMDFPFEERRKLTYWSDLAAGTPEMTGSNFATNEERNIGLADCAQTFTKMWNDRVDDPSGDDFISMLIRSPATSDMVNSPIEFIGNIILLIIGGNDTTRNTMTASVLSLNQFPDQYNLLRQDVGLIPKFVSEVIRWQTPVTCFRRTTTRDTELGGKLIKKGEKVVIWYVSGNRDEDVIADPNSLNIMRDNVRHHLSFGFGIHRCMGNRLAEMQLRVVWEEIMKRFHWIEVVGEPVRARSNVIRGYKNLPVRLHALK